MKSLVFATALALGSAAHAATTYELTITNGASMPLSPSVTYVHGQQSPLSQPGKTATAGFVQLCQTGNPATRAMELNSNREVSFVTQTQGLIMPGESRSLDVRVDDPATQSIQFEVMYGKTKDTCGLVSFNGHSLQALKQHVTSAAIAIDEVVQTGAFRSPALPMGESYLNSMACQSQATAIDCLRALSTPVMNAGPIRAAEPFLSSVSMFLERRYGAAETQSLLLSGAGGIRFQLKLKH